MSVLKPTLLGLGLAVAVVAAAQAQGVNIANVPAEGPRASSHGYQGPQQRGHRGAVAGLSRPGRRRRQWRDAEAVREAGRL